MAIHDIEMEPIRSGIENGPDIRLKMPKIAGEYGCGNEWLSGQLE
jgi:hypothetical protein